MCKTIMRQILYIITMAFIVSSLSFVLFYITEYIPYDEEFFELFLTLIFSITIALMATNFTILKIKSGKIIAIKGDLTSFKSITDIPVTFKKSNFFGRVYIFQIPQFPTSINQRMYSIRDFKIIEKYIRKHNKIIESKKNFF